MTVDEAIQLANNGNVNAMHELAAYYSKCDDIEESKKWTFCAADMNYLPCIIAAVSAAKMDAHANELLELYDDALNAWVKAANYYMKGVDHQDASNEERQKLEELYHDIPFGIGYNLFLLKRYDDALNFLESNENDFWECKLLQGICYCMSEKRDSETSISKAYQLLRTAKKINVSQSQDNELLVKVAFLQLSSIYRKFPEITGVKNGVEVAYQCVVYAASLSDGVAEWAKGEAIKYKKKALGGYTYNG